jgi:transcriptional regulator with XRE-family HTH domain
MNVLVRALHQLARIRINRGLSQAELGAKAGFSQQYISMLERGLVPSDPNHVLRLAAVLDVEPKALSARELTICTSPGGNVAVTCASE